MEQSEVERLKACIGALKRLRERLRWPEARTATDVADTIADVLEKSGAPPRRT